MEPFEFEKQDEIGKEGEQIFIRNYPEFVKLHDYSARSSDFIHPVTKQLVELKTDTYSMFETPNLFIETFSNNKNFRPGGPFRCEGLFAYFFLQNMTLFWFDAYQLCLYLDWLKAYERRIVEVPNRGRNNKPYTTEGRVVPRHLLKPVMIKVETLK